MTYNELKRKQQKEVNKLPTKAAFGEEQFKQMMAEWGLSANGDDLAKIASLGMGVYCLKKDVFKIYETFDQQANEMDEFLKKDENLIDALKKEFANHECGYTWNFTEGIEALGFNPKVFLSDKHKESVFMKARKEYINNL